MKCVILQPSYIPWRGYFHLIQKADVFVFYDDVQYDKHGWRNRNRIKTSQGVQWLTIPVLSSGAVKAGITIDRIRINWDRPWNATHLATLSQAYGKAPFFKEYLPLLEGFYAVHAQYLAEFLMETTITIAGVLGIANTRFVRSSQLDNVEGGKTDRIVSILRKVGADHYISGPSAKSYLEEEKLAEAGITLEYMVYDYPEYPQLHQPYEPGVSILDTLFMCGPESGKYIW
jgi:hypothetical protein